MKFIRYTQKFPNLGFSDNLSAEDLEESFKNKKMRLQKMRNELHELSGLNEIEIVQFMNLCPNSLEEAVSWIPSLERILVNGNEIVIKKAIEIVQKNTPVESNY